MVGKDITKVRKLRNFHYENFLRKRLVLSKASDQLFPVSLVRTKPDSQLFKNEININKMEESNK